jgi:hypothetical protein
MSKKITIANPEVLSNGSGDEVRNYLYRWIVNSGQIILSPALRPSETDLSFDLSYIVYVPPTELGDTDIYTGESQIKENIMGKATLRERAT